MSASLKNKILGKPGYAADIHLSPDDLETLRHIVRWSYLDALQDAGIERYGNHAEIFTKRQRILRPIDVTSIKRLDFMESIKRELGDFGITNIMLPDGTVENHAEIYWRIVRSNEPSDVGVMHRDSQFHAEEKARLYPDKQLIKCWIPLWCEENCGLLIGLNEIFWKPGTVVMFNSEVPHTGMINIGKTARVSMEITLVVDGSLQ